MSEHTELIMEGHLCEGCGVFLKTHGIEGVSRQACEKAAAALAAQQPQPDLHAAIMNLPCKPPAILGKTEAASYRVGHRDARHAAAELVSVTRAGLQGNEQYRLQMAGISTVAIGYWKEGDSISPDYDTPALHDVAKLYRSYDTAYKVAVAAQRLAEELCEDDENQVLVAALNKALDAWVAECSLPRSEMSAAKT